MYRHIKLYVLSWQLFVKLLRWQDHMVLFQGLRVAAAASCPIASTTAACVYSLHHAAVRLYSSAAWGNLLLSKFRGGLQSIQRDRYRVDCSKQLLTALEHTTVEAITHERCRYPSERIQPGQVSPQLHVPADIPRPDYVRCSTAARQLNRQLELHDQQARGQSLP